MINNIDVYDKEIIAESLNKYFIDVGPNLAEKIPNTKNNFKSYMKKINNSMPNYEVSDDEFKEAFFSLKINKSPGFDNISFNVIKHCFDDLLKPLKHISSLSLTCGIFPDQLKIANIAPFFKTGEKDLVKDYRPISILPCFSKVLERIMYNRLYISIFKKTKYCIFQNLTLTFKSKHKLAPNIFQEKFQSVQHKYPTKFSHDNFYIPKKSIATSKFAISHRGPFLWNNFLDSNTKQIISLAAFQTNVKQKLFAFENEISMF